MRDIILVDIDHVISDAFWRDDIIFRSKESGNWDDYHGRGKQDKPLDDMVHLIRMLSLSSHLAEVWGITARPEKWRKQSMEWFVKNNVMLHNLLMRPEDVFKPAPQIKVDLCKEHGIIDRVLCIFDDREDVVSAFRELGITAFHVHSRRSPA